MDTETTKAYGRAIERELERFFAAIDEQINCCGVTDVEAVEVLNKVCGLDLADGFENWIAGT